MKIYSLINHRSKIMIVGVSDQGVLNQLVNLFCVLPIRMVMQRDTRFILVQAIEALLPV